MIFYDKPTIHEDAIIMSDIYKCIERITKDTYRQMKVVDELSMYTNAVGVFGHLLAILERKTKAAG